MSREEIISQYFSDLQKRRHAKDRERETKEERSEKFRQLVKKRWDKEKEKKKQA